MTGILFLSAAAPARVSRYRKMSLPGSLSSSTYSAENSVMQALSSISGALLRSLSRANRTFSRCVFPVKSICPVRRSSRSSVWHPLPVEAFSRRYISSSPPLKRSQR